MMSLEYRQRFQRSIGVMSEEEQERIKRTKVAIGGLGLGGAIFLNLVRIGFERFHIADPDVFERSNINRQRLAKETTLGRRKDVCVLEEARSINPDVDVRAFPDGVKPGNVGDFLETADWVVDVVDVFAMEDKLALNQAAYARKLPVVSAGSLGFSGCVVVFDQKGPSFAELSGIVPTLGYEENFRRFLQFLSPEVPSYMAAHLDRALSRSTHIPFLVPGVEIAAALSATQVTQHLLGRGERPVAPQGIYCDPTQLRLERFTADYRARLFRPGDAHEASHNH
jgi:molybdopterin/thiamine biosynthesis adenylyltransferase